MTEIIKEKSALDSAIANAKANGCRVMKAVIDDKEYIYRSLTRKEWKTLQDEALAALDGVEEVTTKMAVENKDNSEDSLVSAAVLYPDTASMLGWPAGIAPRLADLISKISGFDEAEIQTEEL